MNSPNVVCALAAALGAILASGCSGTGRDLTAAGLVSIQTVPAKTVRVAWAEVWQEGGQTVVRGRLVRRGISSCPLIGHVDVEFLNANGQLLEKAHSPEVYVRRTSPGTGPRLSPFELRLAFVPPENSKVVIAYHGGVHEN